MPCLRPRCCHLTRRRLTEERSLTSLQLMLVHSKLLRWLAQPLLPKGWSGGGFKTSGRVEQQRASLQALGNHLASLSVFSFLCKCLSSATSYFASDLFSTSGNFEALMYLATTLTVQAVPSALTLLLISRFHFSGAVESSGTPMQSLLTHEHVSVAASSDSSTDTHRQHAESTSQLAYENARLQAELERVTEESSQQTRRLQEEIALLRTQVASSLHAK